jgi:hypothetical protein
MDNDFIPNSTYFSNGVVVLNDKTNHSYIYNSNNDTVSKCFKYNYLYIPYNINNNIVIFGSINGNKYKTNEIENYAWNSTLSMLNQHANAESLVTIGGDSYIYGLLKLYKRYYCIGNEQYLKDAKRNLTPQNSHILYLDINDIDIHTNEPLDVIINETITDSMINMLMTKNINQLIILDHNGHNFDLSVDYALFNNKILNNIIQIENVLKSSNTYESVAIANCKLKRIKPV